MAWGLGKSLASALLYSDVAVRPPSEALFFFGHLLLRFLLMEAPIVRQAQTAEASPIDLSDAMEALLEFDDSRHRAPLGQLRLSFSTMACAILISLRQSEIAAQRIRQARHRCLHCCLREQKRKKSTHILR